MSLRPTVSRRAPQEWYPSPTSNPDSKFYSYYKHGQLSLESPLVLGMDGADSRARLTEDDSTISHACSGLGFSVAVTSEGDLCAYGTPQSISYETLRGPLQPKSSLCHPPKATECKLPKSDAIATTANSVATSFPIRSLLVSSRHHSVRQVACGVSHCIALIQSDTGDLQLLSWGLGQYGQLGLGEQTHVATFMVPITTSAELRSALSASRGDPQAIQLRCGALSSCLTITHAASSTVWLWGLLPSPQDASAFVQQHIPSRDCVSECPFRIQDVSLGLTHLALLCDQGRVFTWGQNTTSQLGRGLQHRRHHKREDDPVGMQPMPVAFHQPELRFRSIACGYDHTLALSRDGLHVFAWGSNRLGACGATTKFFEYAHPVRVSLASESERILSISCKAHTSLAVVETSGACRVVVWGVYGCQKAHLLPTKLDNQGSGDWVALPWIIAGYGAIQSLVDVDDDDRRHLLTRPQLDALTMSTATTTTVLVTADKELSTPLLTIVGLSVVSSSSSTTASPPVRLGDLHWTRPVFHHIRIFTGDVVVLLLTTSAPLNGDCLRLRPRSSQSDDRFPVNATHLPWSPPSSSSGLSSSSFLYRLVLPFESVGAFDLEWIGDEHQPSALDAIGLLSVDCCLHPRERDDVLRYHHQFLLSCLENAIHESTQEENETTDDPCIVSEFLNTVAHHDEIQHAIVYSPFAGTIEQDQSYSTVLDVDRAAMDRAWRLSRYRPSQASMEIPTALVLWSFYLEPSSHAREDDDDMEIMTWCSRGMEGLSLWNLLFTSTQDRVEHPQDHERVYLSIASEPVVVSGVSNRDNEPDQIEPHGSSFAGIITTPSTVSLSSSVTRLSVPQHAVDFLVSGSQSHNVMHRHSVQDTTQTCGIRLWWNDRGDPFYSHGTTTTEVQIQIHLPDDDPSQSTVLCDLQRELHTFLWNVLDTTQDLSIRTLHHQFFGALHDAEQLQRRLHHLGFRRRAPREVWFSMFAERLLLQQQEEPQKQHNRSGRGQLTLQAVRLFLVDPFHDTFFRQYLGDWRDAMAAQQQHHHQHHPSLSVDELLTRAFPHQPPYLLWPDFVAGLERLHDTVQWQLDQTTVCRLLYHFDNECDGHIDMHGFLRILRHEIPRTESSRQTKSQQNSQRRLGLGRGLRRERPPDVDAFATRDAMRKLFQSRANDGRMGKPRETEARNRKDDTEMKTLLRMGNTRLARIRNLPVSRLLSEGVHFRPRSAKYMNSGSSGDDNDE